MHSKPLEESFLGVSLMTTLCNMYMPVADKVRMLHVHGDILAQDTQHSAHSTAQDSTAQHSTGPTAQDSLHRTPSTDLICCDAPHAGATQAGNAASSRS